MYKLKRFIKRASAEYTGSPKKAAVPIIILCVLILIIALLISSCASGCQHREPEKEISATVPTTVSTSYQIADMPVIKQETLKAGCEIYACTMLLQHYKFDIDETRFSDEFLINHIISYDEEGNMYGPDMNSAYAGNTDGGWGVNAPAMAKSMNLYLETTTSKLRAKTVSANSLSELCDSYIKNDTPVMVWECTNMDEPYVKDTWIVDYVDENAAHEIGETESWMQNEHCMVLMGYDDTSYYFCDSVAGKIAQYDKAVSEQRFADMGKQAIILE